VAVSEVRSHVGLERLAFDQWFATADGKDAPQVA